MVHVNNLFSTTLNQIPS